MTTLGVGVAIAHSSRSVQASCFRGIYEPFQIVVTY